MVAIRGHRYHQSIITDSLLISLEFPTLHSEKKRMDGFPQEETMHCWVACSHVLLQSEDSLVLVILPVRLFAIVGVPLLPVLKYQAHPIFYPHVESWKLGDHVEELSLVGGAHIMKSTGHRWSISRSKDK
jgi:hypothetical protein